MRSTRRERALQYLENQLVTKVKPLKVEGKTTNENISLSIKDVERIKKEIDILKTR